MLFFASMQVLTTAPTLPHRDFVFFYGLLPVSTASLAIVGSYQVRLIAP
jgi:hypothetical protein